MTTRVLVCLSVNARERECAALLHYIISLKACFVVQVDGGSGLGLGLGNVRCEGQGTLSPSFSQAMCHKMGHRGHLCRAKGGRGSGYGTEVALQSPISSGRLNISSW